ncbi:MAG TPA: nucleotide disphospho-sugar-binding domain-containing protein [Acidobacteriaceae bacterium]|nr:nucleotide disphospho-sugar-binding domain-containing protein [Acidobacteriaceae bacterium]
MHKDRDRLPVTEPQEGKLSNRSREGRIIAFATLGSLGDLHPCLALGMELRNRGHRVKIITTEFYRKKVEQAGIEFCPMRPDLDPTASELVGQCEDLRSGPEILFRKIILPHLRSTYDDLLAAVAGADLMLAGELVYAAPLVAEKLGLRWGSIILSPCSFFSAHDPSVLVNAPWMMNVRKAGRTPYRILLNAARLGTRHWWNPVRDLRNDEGLRKSCDPLMQDKFSPDLVLALFSSWLAAPQPDWPAQTLQPGFVFHDGANAGRPSCPELDQFLSSGDPPVVFTLGSTAVRHPGSFYRTSVDAVRRMSARGILIGATREVKWIAPDLLSLPYAPYSEVFPSASVVVHQGGSGTTAQALRAGRPMLFVPWGWDQPDNGARVERKSAALCIPKERYSVERAVASLHRLRSETSFVLKARSAADHIRAEGGLTMAADRIEKLLI